MRRARKPALLRTALAAALAAITIPLIAHTAFGDETALSTPTAQVFPTRTGVGVAWNPVDASTYHVERKEGSADWGEVSGPLSAESVSWVDDNIAPGTTASYRVVATTDAETAASAPVTTTRNTTTPAVGDIDVLALDVDPGTTWPHDEVADAVTASAPAGGSRTLSAGTVKVRLPAFIAGPGNYSLTPSELEFTQGDHSCTASGYLSVTAVAYTATLELDTLAASLRVHDCDGNMVFRAIDLRYHSTFGYQALSVTPEQYDFGKVKHGTSADAPFVVKNTGTEPVRISGVSMSMLGTAWRLNPDNPHDCPQMLPPAATCTVNVRWWPASTGPDRDTLTISDSTSLERHTVAVTGYGVDVPQAQEVTVRPTYNGHTVSWQSRETAGERPFAATTCTAT